MNQISLIALSVEGIIITYVLVKQWKTYKQTQRLITEYSNAIPEIQHFGCNAYRLPTKDIASYSPTEVLERRSFYDLQTPDFWDDKKYEDLHLIDAKTDDAHPFQRILTNINTYMLRNKGSVADFNLLKDIVDRHTDTQETAIQSSLATPLYWGLFGTMIGIVIGLAIFAFSFGAVDSTAADGSSSLQNDAMTGHIISLLISVALGMLASAFGVWLLIQNAVVHFKNAKMSLETNKNGFYTFLQTELLPVLSQDMNSSFRNLQLNIQSFNQDFSKNIGALKTLMHGHAETIKNQHSILTKLEHTDITKLQVGSLRTIEKIDNIAANLGSFHIYLTQMNGFIENSRELTTTVRDILERTDDIGAIAAGITASQNESRELTAYLSAHFKDLDEYNDSILSHSSDVKDDFLRTNTETILNLAKGLDGLQAHFDQALTDFRFAMSEQQNTLRSTLNSAPSQLRNLDTIPKNIEALRKAVENNDAKQSVQNNALITALQQMNDLHRQALTAATPWYSKVYKKTAQVIRTLAVRR
jgi:hypothetical protein